MSLTSGGKPNRQVMMIWFFNVARHLMKHIADLTTMIQGMLCESEMVQSAHPLHQQPTTVLLDLVLRRDWSKKLIMAYLNERKCRTR